MSKNVFDYIFMGVRKNKSIKTKKIEAEKAQERAEKFDKAFSDKTYSVAKKVLDNVEKVADYDYDALFDRVNKVIDDKLPKNNKSITSDERKKRSQEFDSKVHAHPDRFNIDDYLKKEQNYKDSIIEKTKKNIQKKYSEADNRHKGKSPDENKETVENVKNISSVKAINQNEVDETDGPAKEIINDNDVKEVLNQEVTSPIKKLDETLTSTVEKLDEGLNSTIDKLDKGLTSTIEKLDDGLTSSIEQLDEGITTALDKFDDKVTPSPSEPAKVPINESVSDLLDEFVDEFVEEVNQEIISSIKNPDKEILSSQVGEDTNKNLNETDEVIVSDSHLESEEVIHVVMNEESKPADVSLNESLEYVSHSVNNIINQSIEQLEVDEKDLSAELGDEELITSKVRFSDYSKKDLKKSNTYYKKRKKDKFAKRMKVELEDSIIGQQKRSIKRLFKFSLSFKLSFVFMILIILTVVSLSVAFYLGIDYVIQLRDLGMMEDIQFFKDVLLVLLIIFDLVAILICISLGTKASRELVRPIDEMTLIVKQINANDMERRLNVKGMHDELKELAMTFNDMLDRIENSYETQNRFTSDASHELRTPIAVIQGYINMLDRWGKADGEILEESIEAIKSESHNMKRLTEKLLLLAKADKGILELDFQSFELNDLIDEITRETQMIDSNHNIVNNINDVRLIYADRESLKQAIRIFVDNAVKYTPEGGTIALNSYINKKNIYIEIEDNGIGISKEDMSNIFNRFYRVDKSRTKDSGGHGLGLSIAKWIISQHKGEIEVKSELDKGTVITLVLSPMKE